MRNATTVNAEITALLRARNTLLSITTDDELRVERALIACGAAAKYEVRFGDVDTGITSADGTRIERVGDPAAMLEFIRGVPGSRKERAVYVLRDMHKWLADPSLLRKLRNVAKELRVQGGNEARAIILLSPTGVEFPKDAPELKPIDYPLPDREDIARMIDSALLGVSEFDKEGRPLRANACANGTRERVIDAALGLNAREVEDSFSFSLVTTGSKIDPAIVAGEKKRVISGMPGISWHDPDPRGLDAVGGCGELKAWCLSRKPAFSAKARTFGLPAPKGVMLLGPPGTGKSLTAKCAATVFGMPLLRLDLGGLLSKYVGESQGAIRRVLALAETVAPCVLWIDEIEKALAGSTGSQGDGGVATDQLGTLLSWMQEKTATVFVVATANDVRSLPPELLRKGRFDELFFVDLPQPGERAEIVAASLKAFNRPTEGIDLACVASVTDGFVGAEIASLVPDALFEAFADGERALTTEDLVRAAGKVVPLSKTASEKITTLREWAKGRCRMASTPEVASTSNVRTLDL